MPDDSVSALIDVSLDPPPRGEIGPIKRLVRRLLLRIGRAHARHQQQIDRELLAVVAEARHVRDQQAQQQADDRARIEDLQATIARIVVLLEEAASGIRDQNASSAQHATRLDALEQSVTTVEKVATAVRAQNQWSTQLAARTEALEERQTTTEALVATDSPLYGERGLQLEAFEEGPLGSVVGYRDVNPPKEADAVYLGFENYFRGPEDVVSARQRAYVPLLKGHDPVLDVGCGRGEFLELMRNSGIEARGIDIDEAMVEQCHKKGLDSVERAEAVGYLDSLDTGLLGAIFAAQVIEHLEYEQLVRFFAVSRVKLAPEGLLIVETVNPHSPQALKHFWIDPTHRNPLFPEVVVALLRLTGFASAFIWHPGGVGDPKVDRVQQADYAVIARSPGESSVG
jgi:2-polyprenyl-3-methyl-5-hydroxy-6-metoxy-1,4-benzoquinol methylase